MNKILLVYEDYSDLMAVETALKKVGFDVIGLTNEYAISEQILAFNPELVVGAGRGGKVSSLGVGKRLKEMARWQGKVVLLFPSNIKPSPQDLIKLRVDMLLEAPVPTNRLVQVLAKLLGHDEAMLLERLGKSTPAEVSETKAASNGKGGAAQDDAIYVKGSQDEEAAAGSLPKDSHDESLNVEKMEDSEDRGFRFGDRMSGADVKESQESAVDTAFPDVDLKALEHELIGGGEPEVERIHLEDKEDFAEKSEDLPVFEAEPSVTPSPLTVAGAEEPQTSVVVDATWELRQAELGLAEKMAKYKALTADVKVAPKSTMSRVESRKRQLELLKSWKTENLQDQDELRREFTKSLFKK